MRRALGAQQLFGAGSVMGRAVCMPGCVHPRLCARRVMQGRGPPVQLPAGPLFCGEFRARFVFPGPPSCIELRLAPAPAVQARLAGLRPQLRLDLGGAIARAEAELQGKVVLSLVGLLARLQQWGQRGFRCVRGLEAQRACLHALDVPAGSAGSLHHSETRMRPAWRLAQEAQRAWQVASPGRRWHPNRPVSHHCPLLTPALLQAHAPGGSVPGPGRAAPGTGQARQHACCAGGLPWG